MQKRMKDCYTKEDLIEIFVKQGKTVKEFCSETGRAESSVREFLRKQGIDYQQRNGDWIDYDTLYDIYVQKQHTPQEIADSYNCSCGRVYKKLRQFGIPLRDERKCDVDIEEIKRLYIDEKMFIKDIAKKLGCSSYVVSMTLDKMGIKRLSPITDDELIYEYVDSHRKLDDIANQYGTNSDYLYQRAYKLGIICRQNRVSKYDDKYKDAIDYDVLYQKYVIENKDVSDIAQELQCCCDEVLSCIEQYLLKRNTLADIIKDDAVSLYEKGLSLKEIGNIIGCSSTTARKALEKADVYVRSKRPAGYWAEIFTMELLYDLYIKQELTIQQIADEYKCPRNTVARYLRKYELLGKQRNFASKKGISKDVLYKLYVEEEKDVVTIGDMLQCSGVTVQRYLKEYDIPIRGSRKIYKDDLILFCENTNSQKNRLPYYAEAADFFNVDSMTIWRNVSQWNLEHMFTHDMSALEESFLVCFLWTRIMFTVFNKIHPCIIV